MKRISELSAGRPVKTRGLAHLLLAVCLLTIAGPVIALADARMGVDAEQILNSTSNDYDGIVTMGQLHPHNAEDGHDAVYDGVTYLFAGMVDSLAAPSWRNAAKGGARALDANKLNHIFGDAAHGLDDVVKAAGSREAAFRSMEKAAQGAFDAGKFAEIRPGVFEGAANIGGVDLTVRGALVDGVFRIGTAFR